MASWSTAVSAPPQGSPTGGHNRAGADLEQVSRLLPRSIFVHGQALVPKRATVPPFAGSSTASLPQCQNPSSAASASKSTTDPPPERGPGTHSGCVATGSMCSDDMDRSAGKSASSLPPPERASRARRAEYQARRDKGGRWRHPPPWEWVGGTMHSPYVRTHATPVHTHTERDGDCMRLCA